jgi:hypothetical protein
MRVSSSRLLAHSRTTALFEVERLLRVEIDRRRDREAVAGSARPVLLGPVTAVARIAVVWTSAFGAGPTTAWCHAA